LKIFSDWLILRREWVLALEQYRNTPDPWAAVGSQTKLTDSIGVKGPDDHEGFTPEKRDFVAQQLNELRTFIIATNELMTDKVASLDQKLEYLQGATFRVSPFDWRGLLLSVLVNSITAGIFAPQRAQELFTFVVQLLGPILGFDLPPPPLVD
jgi:hypothetical protein